MGVGRPPREGGGPRRAEAEPPAPLLPPRCAHLSWAQRLFPKVGDVLQVVQGPCAQLLSRLSGSSVVVPSLAEQDPEEQQDGGCEAHAGEILHRVVWGEGAQVSPAPSPGTGVCAQGTRLSGEDMAPSTAPDGDAVHPHSRL